MRNLKRALSLALAAIMVMGLMVVGASAASTYDNFTDKDEIVNQEAVNTMVSLGVLAGKDDGSYFDPTGIVTRGEMAKIVAVCLNGGKEPVLGDSTNIPKFSDVPTSHWAYKYIAYCVQQNIIAGRGDGTFAPDEPVTGSAAAKMFLCALGYRADLEGLTGNEWELNTNILANQDASLYEGLESINASAGLSRDNTAQMAYNAVQAQEVTYNNLFGDYTGVLQTEKKGTMLQNRFGVVKVEGIVVANEIFGLSDYSATPTGKSRFIDCNGYTVIENGVSTTKYYNDVYPVSIPNEYVGQRVVIYVKFPNALAPNAAESVVIGEPILSSKNTVATTGSKLKDDDAVKSFLRDNDLSVGAEQLVNGNANPNRGVLTVANNVFTFAKGDVALSNGVNARGTKITFIDNTGDGTVDYILKETKHLAKVTVYNEDKSELTLAGVGNINFKDIANEEDVAAGDIVLFTKYDNTYYFNKPETVTGTFSAYNADATTMVMDGTSYADTSVGFNAASTDLMKYEISKDEIGNTYTLYLDDFGNVIAVELADEAVGNYALVLSTATTSSGTTSVLNKAEVKLLKADGTTSTYTVNLAASGARFGWANQNNTTKENNMLALLENPGDQNGNDKIEINDTTEASALTNTIVTYIVGEDGTVTLGNPGLETSYSALYNNSSTTRVKSTQTSYNFAHTVSYLNGAGVAPYTGTQLTSAAYPNGINVVLNDSTLFFFRDETGNDVNADPVVVQGLKNLPASAIANSKLISAVYRTDTTGTNVAKAVYVDAEYEGAVNYLYVEADYTATELTSTGERVFTYPVVFEDGTAGEIKVREAYNTGFASGKVVAYTTDGEYYKAAPAEADKAETGAGNVDNTNVTVNGYVVTHSQADTITMQWGLNNGLGTVGNGGYVQKAFKVNADTKVINVEKSGAPYDAKSISADSTVALATDSDGFVQVAFVKDSNVSFRTVTNNTGVALNSTNVAVKTTANFTGAMNHGDYIYVASGFKFNFDQTYNTVAAYTKTTDGGEKTDLTVKGNTDNYASIDMPAYATLTLGTSGGSTPTPTGNTLTLDVATYGNATIYDKDGKNITDTFTGTFYKKSATVPTGDVIIVENTWTPGDKIWIGGTEYTVGSRKEIQLNIAGDTELKALYAVDYVETKYDTNNLTLGAADILVEDGTKGELVLPLTYGSLTQNTRVAFTGATVKSVSGTGVTVEGDNVVVASTASGDASITVEVTNVTTPVTVTTTGTQVFATGSLAMGEPTSGTGKNVTVGVTADKAYVASGETVTYTITVATAESQTTAVDSEDDTITVTFTGGGTMVTGTDNVDNGTGSVAASTAVITIDSNSVEVSGTYTVTSTTVSSDVSIAAAYATV